MLELNKLYLGDCLEVMKIFPDNCIDSIVTDPPYGIGFMGREWDTFKDAKATRKEGYYITKAANGSLIKHRKGYGAPMSAGLYDHSRNKEFQQWFTVIAKECLRVLKPGGHLLSFGGTRTYHRMVCGIEDAGFEIRDCIQWLYGSGFPKNLNIGKQIDKITGAEREIVGKDKSGAKRNCMADDFTGGQYDLTKGDSKWDGWGTGLKPANEPIILARKPISEKNIAENVLKWETGGINIDGCRIEHNEPEEKLTNRTAPKSDGSKMGLFKGNTNLASPNPKGRWPANVIFDEEAAELLDEQSGILQSGGGNKGNKKDNTGIFGSGKAFDTEYIESNSGGASRFFYCAKASKSERNAGLEGFEDKNGSHTNTSGRRYGGGNRKNWENPYKKSIVKNNHPTVKPIKLMRYLVRLITPPGGICLDPFIGSGTTAIACIEEGFNYIGIEKEKEYFDIAKARISYVKRRSKGFFKPNEIQSKKISRQKGFF